LETFFLGEEVPRNYDPIFKKVVRDNFEKVVMDPYKHVVISYVTEWCEHCKEIKKMYKDIKTNLNSNVKDIVFAKVNYDKNNIEGINI